MPINEKLVKWEEESQSPINQKMVRWEEESDNKNIKEKLKTGAFDVGKGLLSGAADIGNTLINASTFVPRKIAGLASSVYGTSNPLERLNAEREQGLQAFNNENQSLPFKVGRIGGNIAGTMGAGGVLGNVMQAASKTPQALNIAKAVRGGGFGGGSLPVNIAGGAANAGLSALLVDPSSAPEAAAIGGAIPVVGKAAQLGGGLAGDVIGGIGTFTGGNPLRTAASSGMRGGEAAQSFKNNLRGNVPQDDVLTIAKANLSQIGQNRAAQYRANMDEIKGDKTQLSFSGIDNAIKNAQNKVGYQGKVVNETGANALGKIDEAVKEWKSADPALFHTPEGIDALKQRIGGIVESIPFNEKQARLAGNEVYNSIKQEINKQAPTYAKVMKDYSQATELIKEIEGTLSLGGRANPDTAMRKLQSLMRNNVNTNYGNRLNLASELEQQGGQEIMPAIAGQALSSWTPRGLGSAVTGAAGVGGALASGSLAPLLTIPMSSPRLMGEAAYGLGALSRPISGLLPAVGGGYAGYNK